MSSSLTEAEAEPRDPEYACSRTHWFTLNRGFRRNQRSWSIHGNGWRSEKRICGIWWGFERRVQKWAPLMCVIERIHYVRFGWIKFGITRTKKVFFDGNEPKYVKGDS